MLPLERQYLVDMLEATTLAQDFVNGMTWEDFQFDLKCQAAVTRQFEIIGEAARRISRESHAEFPQIPWHQIIGMRNRLAHEYERVNVIRLWETVQIALPGLVDNLKTILTTLEPES